VFLLLLLLITISKIFFSKYLIHSLPTISDMFVTALDISVGGHGSGIFITERMKYYFAQLYICVATLKDAVLSINRD